MPCLVCIVYICDNLDKKYCKLFMCANIGIIIISMCTPFRAILIFLHFFLALICKLLYATGFIVVVFPDILNFEQTEKINK